MSIAFHHERLDDETRDFWENAVAPKGGKTVAYEMISKEEMDSVIQGLTVLDSVPVLMKVGVATCHPEDLYNKKVGREVAMSRLGWRGFKVREISENFFRFVDQTEVIDNVVFFVKYVDNKYLKVTAVSI